MQTKLKKTIFAALPVAGLLLTAPAAFAHGDDHHDRPSNRHEKYHDRRNDLHQEFHEHPSSQREHERFHRYLRRDHYDFHNDRRWSRSRDRDWRNDRWYGGGRGYNDYYRRGWDGGRRSYDNDYYRGSSYYNQPWWNSWWYR